MLVTITLLVQILFTHTLLELDIFVDTWKFIIVFMFFVFYLQSGGNEDPNEVLLDSEMEKVFAGPTALKEKFDVTTFQDTVHPIPGSFKNINSGKYIMCLLGNCNMQRTI